MEFSSPIPPPLEPDQTKWPLPSCTQFVVAALKDPMREECKDFENVLMACVRPVKMPLTSLTSKAFKAPPPPSHTNYSCWCRVTSKRLLLLLFLFLLTRMLGCLMPLFMPLVAPWDELQSLSISSDKISPFIRFLLWRPLNCFWKPFIHISKSVKVLLHVMKDLCKTCKGH